MNGLKRTVKGQLKKKMRHISLCNSNMVLGIKSSVTRRKEGKRRKYIRNENENGKRNS